MGASVPGFDETDKICALLCPVNELTSGEVRLSLPPPMKLLGHKPFLRLLALCAALLFVGDLAADPIADLAGSHCSSQTSQSSSDHGKEPCSHCSCAVHSGAVVAPDFAIQLHNQPQPASVLRGIDEATPPRLASAIDHPPQLA